jgi:hypothetical protein
MRSCRRFIRTAAAVPTSMRREGRQSIRRTPLSLQAAVSGRIVSTTRIGSAPPTGITSARGSASPTGCSAIVRCCAAATACYDVGIDGNLAFGTDRLANKGGSVQIRHETNRAHFTDRPDLLGRTRAFALRLPSPTLTTKTGLIQRVELCARRQRTAITSRSASGNGARFDAG